jgi:serine phosphatase RsbU (regulator of sigma subunit)
MQTSKKYPNHVFVGYQDDVVAIELIEQANSEYFGVKKVTHLPNITGEVRTITEDGNGDLWLGMNTGKAAFIQFADDSNILDYQIHFLDGKNGLPNGEGMKVVTLNDKLSFLTGKGIYKQTDETQNVSSSMQLEYHAFWNSFSKYDSINYRDLYKLTEREYIMSGDITAFLKKENGKLIGNQAPFAKIDGVSSLGLDSNYIYICTNSSFYMYNLNKDSVRTDKIYNTLIRKVSIAQDSVIFKGNYYTKKGNKLEINTKQSAILIPVMKYENNAIKFHFAANYYENAEKMKYSYFLESFNKKWSNWSNETKAIFTNVPEGKYVFKVKAKNIYDVESEIATYQFEILAPWYRTWYMYFAYLIILAGFIWLIIKFNARRLVKEKIELESIVQKRTKEVQEQKEELIQTNEEVRLQKEEILAQNEELMQANEEVSATSDALAEQNDKLAKSYKNVQLLSVIGQKITAKLSVKDIIDTVYENVNSLMDAEVFSIGVINEYHKRLDFHDTKEKGEILPFHFDELKSKNKLSVYCYKNFATILLKDYDAEINQYLTVEPGQTTAGESTNSLLYLPLGTVENKLGVISVQSFNKNAYTDYHLNILRNIAIYTSIALQNSETYSQIKQQHTQIKSSVNYASTIQNSILPSKKHIDSLLDNFLVYRPKDIVSGDFYWLSKVGDTIFVAVVDCTGHGVPGAFMSMIGSRLLSEIVNEKKIFETNEILEELNSGIKKALRQEQTDNTDGMDVCLCKIEKNDIGANISFTGAKNPLYIYQQDKSELLRIRGDKKAIGGNHFQNLHFTQTNLSTKKGDMIYLTTDGFVDQNNQERKKYSTKRLTLVLKEIHNKPLLDQKERLETELDEWQGTEKQRDDVTILGIKI